MAFAAAVQWGGNRAPIGVRTLMMLSRESTRSRQTTPPRPGHGQADRLVGGFGKLHQEAVRLGPQRPRFDRPRAQLVQLQTQPVAIAFRDSARSGRISPWRGAADGPWSY